MHKFACTNVTLKKDKNNKKKNGGETLTHAAVRRSNKRLQVVYTHVHAYIWAPVPQGSQ